MSSEKKTKSAQAYERMRQMIIERKINADHRWSIREASRTLGMSVSPVSEAVRKLESDGLIKTRSRSGIRLRLLTEDEKNQARIVREALEVQAARIVAKRYANDKKKATQLREMAQTLYNRLTHGEEGKAALLDYDFHLLFVSWAGCRMLTETYERIALLSKLENRDWIGTWTQLEATLPVNHMAMVDALLGGNADVAEAAVRNHIHGHTLPDSKALAARLEKPLKAKRERARL